MATPDTNFTTWVDYPSTPSNPGASDLNRLQNNDLFFTTTPCLKVTDGQGAFSDSTFATVTPWRTTVYSTTTVNGVTFFSWSGNTITFNVAGTWRYDVSIPMDAGNTTGYRQIRLIRNGTQVVDFDEKQQVSATRSVLLKLNGEVRLLAGDNLLLQVYQTSGTTANIDSTLGEPFWCTRWVSS